MYHFRPFLNSDPPRLAEIWNSQPPQRGLARPVSAALLEQLAFSKMNFDRNGLIVALGDERPVGFVHAAFGPTEDESRLSTELGVIAMLMVKPSAGGVLPSAGGDDEAAERATLADELLARGEDYLRGSGAKVLYAGGIRPLNLFYLGFYGGSELPGILDSSGSWQAFYSEHGYREIDRVVVLHADLSRFRPTVSRQQMQLRRRLTIEVSYDPPATSWWEATTVGGLDRMRFELVPRGGLPTDQCPAATATFWNLEPLAGCWGIRAAGLLDIDVAPAWRRQGMATYLLGEALRQLHAEGIMLVEAQTMAHNTASLAMYHRLGFAEVDQGAVLRKETSA